MPGARQRRGPGHSSPYGQACMSCFKAKCKCVARPDGEGCQRCHRLEKQCHPSDSLRRRAIEKKQNSNARISKLEGRLDGLVSLLHAVVKAPDSAAALGQVLDGEGVQQQQTDAEPLIATPVLCQDPAGNDTDDADNGVAPPWTASSSPMTTSPPDLLEPSADEAEGYLEVFRSRMLRHFAFVHLPADLTAQQLRWDRPFLFRAMVAVVSPSARDKVARGRELKRVLAEVALQENQASMDLLLGLLTYIAWGWDNFLVRAGLSRLMMLAMSVVGEMRLNKAVPPDLRMTQLLVTGVEGCRGNTAEMTSQLFLERQRAVLGCFLLSSIVSAHFGQVDALQWRPQLEEGLDAISANTDCPTDAAFAFQVRLQLLAQKAIQVRHQEQLDQAQTGTTASSALPYIRALQGRLQALRASLSPALQPQEILMAHSYYIELSLSETIHTANSIVPLTTDPMPNLADTIGAGTSTGGKPWLSVDRASCFWQSVGAINACATTLLTVAPSDVLGISFVQFAQLVRCIVVLNRLTTLEDPAWDRAAVRAIVDMPVLLDRMAEKLELAAAVAGEQEPDDVYTKLASVMRVFRSGMAGGNGMALENQDQPGEEAVWSQLQSHPQACPATGDGGPAHGQVGMMSMMRPFGFLNDTVVVGGVLGWT